MAWTDQLVTIVVAVIASSGVVAGSVVVDRRTRKAARTSWEETAALRGQQIDGENVERMRREIARLDARVDEAEEENAQLRARLTAAEKRVAILGDVLRSNHIEVPPHL